MPDKPSDWLNQKLVRIAGVALVAMMLLSVANMIMRLFSRPFGGTAEAVGWLAAITAAFTVGYTQLNRGHVAIGLVMDRMPRKVQAVVDTVVWMASAILFGLATWQITLQAARLRELGNISETMHIPFYPVTYLVAFGLACFTFVLIADAVKSFREVIGR